MALAKPATTEIKTVLVSQPKPESVKSPYYNLEKNYSLKVDFRQFIRVEGVDAKEFRKSKINLEDYQTVIMTSRTAIDHFFRVAEALRYKVSSETRYFCKSEAIALYLQKYIQYRKRKVFFADGSDTGLQDLITKYKDKTNFLFPCTDVRKEAIPAFMEENGIDYTEAIIYQTIAEDLSDLKDIYYDLLVFFSPSGIWSLFKNFPDFVQNNTRIAVFGPATYRAAEEAGLRIDIKAPVPEARSMSEAIELYIKDNS